MDRCRQRRGPRPGHQRAEPEALGARVYTPARRGTLQNDILAGARREGRLAVAVTSLRGLMTEIAAGHPVLRSTRKIGAIVGAIVLIFLVLLITDLLGLTDVYPFVNKKAE